MDGLLADKQFLIDSNTSKWKNKEEITENWPRFQKIFKLIIEDLEETNSIHNDKERLIVIDSLSIWFLRIARLLQNKKISQYVNHTDINNLIFPSEPGNDSINFMNLDIIFDYIIDFWNDSNNSVMNALKDLFHKLLSFLKILCDSTKFCHILNHWLDEILKLSPNLRIKYYFVEVLSQHINMCKVLSQNEKFIERSLQLMSSAIMANNVGKCLVHLLQNVYVYQYDGNEDKLDLWLQIWYSDVHRYLHSQELFTSINLYFLQPLFTIMPSSLFQLFMKRIKIKFKDPVVILSLFKIGQELGLDEEPFHKDRLVSLKFLTELLKVDQFKLTVFQILTFSNKKSKPIQPYIFDILQQNWNIFFVDVNFETRTYFESCLKNFILRVRDSTYSLSRDANKLAKANKFPKEQQEKLNQIEIAKHFITNFYNYLLNSIIPGIYFQKISLSLTMIKILIESGLDEKVNPIDTDKNNIRGWSFHLSILTDKCLLRLLIDNLNNKLADVRTMAKDILINAFNNDNKLIAQTINSMIDKDKISEKARMNMNAYQNTEIGATLELFLFGIATNQRQLIDEQLDLLRKEIDKVSNDPLANVQNNICASFTTLSMFLDSYVTSRSKKNSKAYDNGDSSVIDEIREKVWEQIEKSWQWSGELMCHDSADGLLPAKYLNSQVSDRVITSYAFKVVKESSELVEILLLKYNPTVENLDKMGQFLIDQLFSIRHSGAFHAVLPTFRTFCIQCRQLAPKKLENWLTSILESLEVKTQHITRRSGGLPYLITNILITETDKNRPQLNKVFNKLLRIIETSDNLEHQDKLDLPQVNAFNCIKAIFIEAKLSDACTPFFPIALQFSLKYFTSEIWALRNCSLMLFTSLQIRVFGKNGKSISARLFFTKYDSVKDVLLSILKKSVVKEEKDNTMNGTKNAREVESIFLVLNILMCLKKTPGYDGLKPFIIEVIKCLGNKQWKVRDMAARTLSILMDGQSSDDADSIHNFVSDLTVNSQNKSHGHLLFLKYFLQDNKTLSDDKLKQLVEKIINKRDEFLLHNSNFITVKAYLELVDHIFDTFVDLITEDAKREIVSNFGNYFIQYNSMNYVVNGSAQLCLSAILKFLLCYESEDKLILCALGLESPFYEVQHVAIDHIKDNNNLLSDNDVDVVNKLKNLFYDKQVIVTIKPSIIKCLQSITDGFKFEELLEILRDDTTAECIKLAAIECIGQTVPDNDAVEATLDSVKQYLKDDAAYNFRLASLNCLINCYERVQDANILFNIYKMLFDDDIDLRLLAAKYLNDKFLPDNGLDHVLKSPNVAAEEFSKEFVNRFDANIIEDILSDQIVSFLHGKGKLLASVEHFTGLFDSEKDNQYRNDIDLLGQCIDMLEEKGCYPKSPLILAERYVEELTECLDTNKIQDEPLGWLDNIDALAPILVVLMLQKRFGESALLSETLNKHCNHPILTHYAI